MFPIQQQPRLVAAFPLTVTVPGGMAAGFLVMEKQYGDLLGALRVGVWLE